MVTEFNYISINEVLSRLLRHPLLQDLTLESVIQYTVDFISFMGLPKVYQDKTDTIEISEYRGVLPCGIVSINQVKSCKTGKCLRSMTDSFFTEEKKGEHTFRTQGRIIFVSFKEGDIQVSYKAIPVDKDGLPLLPDNPIFMKALELFIKKEWFTIKFDLGKIRPEVLQNTQQEYAFRVGQLNNEFTIPSISEMQSITNMWNTLIPKHNQFKDGFKSLGDKEYIKAH